MADNISARRQSANSFFLAVNTAVIGIAGYVGGMTEDRIWVIGLSGMALCYVWYRMIRSYKGLNSSKFKIIHEIEKQLPLAPYDAEWEALNSGGSRDRYLPFTNIEARVPAVFGTLHGIVLLLLIPWSGVVACFTGS